MLQQQIFNLPQGTILDSKLLREHLYTLWNIAFSHESVYGKNKHILIICKVQFNNGERRSISEMRKVNYTDRHLYHEFLTTRLGILSDTYTDTPIDKLIFEYFNREGIADDERSLVNLVDYTETKFNFNTMQFPLTMNPHNPKNTRN